MPFIGLVAVKRRVAFKIPVNRKIALVEIMFVEILLLKSCKLNHFIGILPVDS